MIHSSFDSPVPIRRDYMHHVSVLHKSFHFLFFHAGDIVYLILVTYEYTLATSKDTYHELSMHDLV